MGEKKILSDEMIDQKLERLSPKNIVAIDPMRMAQWRLETACAMVDNAVSTQTIMREIDAGDLEAYKAGKCVTVEPTKFMTWYKRFRKESHS